VPKIRWVGLWNSNFIKDLLSLGLLIVLTDNIAWQADREYLILSKYCLFLLVSSFLVALLL